MAEITRICFVCLGNIVRSPLAENMFMYLAKEAGIVDKYEVDSAGTSAWHVGEAPDSRMRRVAAQHGLRYNGRARQFKRSDFEKFDLIIAMDRENREDLRQLARTHDEIKKIHLLREYDPLGGEGAGVPDPYYGGIDGFIETYRVVERSCRNLLNELEEGFNEGS